MANLRQRLEELHGHDVRLWVDGEYSEKAGTLIEEGEDYLGIGYFANDPDPSDIILVPIARVLNIMHTRNQCDSCY